MKDDNGVFDSERLNTHLEKLEYARGECIKFGKWLSDHKLDFQPAKDGHWIGVNMVTYTSECLYELMKKEEFEKTYSKYNL